jgi:hypothetical protein
MNTPPLERNWEQRIGFRIGRTVGFVVIDSA